MLVTVPFVRPSSGAVPSRRVRMHYRPVSRLCVRLKEILSYGRSLRPLGSEHAAACFACFWTDLCLHLGLYSRLGCQVRPLQQRPRVQAALSSGLEMSCPFDFHALVAICIRMMRPRPQHFGLYRRSISRTERPAISSVGRDFTKLPRYRSRILRRAVRHGTAASQVA